MKLLILLLFFTTGVKSYGSYTEDKGFSGTHLEKLCLPSACLVEGAVYLTPKEMPCPLQEHTQCWCVLCKFKDIGVQGFCRLAESYPRACKAVFGSENI